MAKPISAGGQAVIEGVMMRSPHHAAVAVRDPKGRIQLKKIKFTPPTKRPKLLQLPVVRGMAALVEMMVIGIKALTWSADIAVGEEEEKMSFWDMVWSLGFAIGFALLFFKFLPLLIAQLAGKMFPIVVMNGFLFSLIEGIAKLALFFGYLAVISLSKDAQRLFSYHGAEHMAVHCYESKKPLTIKNVKRYKTMHPRCGTSFILFVFLISIILYAFIPHEFTIWGMYAYRILLLPIIAGLSYEVLKYSAKHTGNPIFRLVTLPGIWFQYLTTKRPDDKQIQVAIKAMKEVLKLENRN